MSDTFNFSAAELSEGAQLRYLRALAGCSQTLLQTPTDEEEQTRLLNTALAHLVTGAQVGRAYIFRNIIDPDLGECMGIVAEACAPGVEPDLHSTFNQRAPWSTAPDAMKNALASGRPWGGSVAELWEELPEMRDYLLNVEHLLSVQFFPIFFGDEWWGFVGFDDVERVRQWDEREIMLLGTVAEMFSSALQRWQVKQNLLKERDELDARVHARTAELHQTVAALQKEVAERKQAEQRLNQRLQAEKVLSAITTRLLTEQDFDIAVEQTLKEVGEALNAAVAMLVRIDIDNHNVLAFHRWNAPDIEEKPQVSGESEAWLRQKVYARQPLFLPDVARDVADETVREQLLEREMRAIALFPLVVKDEIAAVLHIRLRHALLDETADDTFSMLQMMSNALNGLLQRQIMLEELEQRLLDRTRELTMLLDVAVLDLETSELADVIAAILPRFATLIDTQAISVHRLAEDGALELISWLGSPDEELEMRLPPETSAHLRDWLNARGHPILATTPAKMALLPHPHAQEQYDTGLAVPIGRQDQPWGVMTCYRREQEAFTLNQIALVVALADYMGIIIENHLLRKRAEDTAILEERQRLARDLHDSVNQSLYGVTLFARAGYNALLEEDFDKARADIARAEQNALQAIKEMRLLLHQLQPLALTHGGLAQALNRRFDQVERRLGVEAVCDIDPDIILPKATEEELYHLISEALNNALKYADASQVSVRLTRNQNALALVVQDDGKGFDPARVRRGMGLDNMQQRAQRIGARLELQSQPGQGTILRCVWEEAL